MFITRKVIGRGIHAFVFLVAVMIFYFGLGVGLAHDPLLGTLMLLLAFAVGGVNLYLILRNFGRG